MEPLLKKTLKRQLPYLIGGTITGIFVTYYYGLLFSIIVNSAIWFVISTIVNKFYYHYTGFKDEMYLVKKYIIHRKNSKSKSIHYNPKAENSVVKSHNNINSITEDKKDNKSDDVGSPIKS